MNAEEFMRYLDSHKGEAWVGNPETLAVAQHMEGEGFLEKTGYRKRGTEVCYQVTLKGKAFIDYSLKRLPGPRSSKTLKMFLGAVDGYIQAFKAENPVGMEDVRRAFGGIADSKPILPEMSFEPPRQKALPSKRKKPSEYVKIDGKFYKQVEDE